MRITDYLDCRTKQIIGRTKEHTFTLIKPNLIPKLGEVITEIQRRGFQICNMKMCNLTRKEVEFIEIILINSSLFHGRHMACFQAVPPPLCYAFFELNGNVSA